MQTSSAFTSSKEPGNCRHLGISIHVNAAHHVVSGGSYFHWLGGNIYVGQLFKLMIHAGQFFLDMLSSIRHFIFYPGDVKEHSVVRTSLSFFYLPHDTSCYMISRQ